MAGYTREEVVILFIRVAEGDIDARNILVNDNMGLVGSSVKKYLNRGMSMEDLVQEGSLGLIKAVEDFDLQKGFEFSTYAKYWIKDAIIKALARNGFQFRMAVPIFKHARKCVASGIPEDITAIKQKLKCSTKTAEKVIACMQANKTESSDFAEHYRETPEFSGFMIDLVQRFDRLDEREKTVVRMRYGFAPYREMNNSEIGKILSLSRESIRLIHDGAIFKLKGM